jgi:hypothetical protein
MVLVKTSERVRNVSKLLSKRPTPAVVVRSSALRAFSLAFVFLIPRSKLDESSPMVIRRAPTCWSAAKDNHVLIFIFLKNAPTEDEAVGAN